MPGNVPGFRGRLEIAMTKHAFGLLGIVLLLSVGQPTTDACDCARIKVTKAEISRAAALFSGRCTKTDKSGYGLVHFQVKHAWKGMVGKTKSKVKSIPDSAYW